MHLMNAEERQLWRDVLVASIRDRNPVWSLFEMADRAVKEFRERVVDVALLKEIEWSHGARVGIGNGEIKTHTSGYCPVCYGRNPKYGGIDPGHKADCKLAKLIGEDDNPPRGG